MRRTPSKKTGPFQKERKAWAHPQRACWAFVCLSVLFANALARGESGEDLQPNPPAAPVTLPAEELASAQRLQEKYPSEPRALNVLGHIHNNHGKRAEAVAYWSKLVALDPSNADAYDAMAKVAFLKGDNSEAIRLWQKTLAIQARRPGVQYQLATALMGVGRLDEAAAALDREIEISPQANDPHTMQGEVYRLLGRYDQALTSFKSSVQIDPNSLKACYGLATVYRALKDKAASERWMARFQQLKTESVQADHDRRGAYDDRSETRRLTARTFTEIASIYAQHDDYQNAERLWLRASALDATQLSCRQNLGQLYHYTKRLDSAIEMCKQLAQLEPENADYLVNMAVFYADLKQYDAAIDTMEKANGLDSGRSASFRFLAKTTLQTSRDAGRAVSYAQQALALEPSAANYFILGKARERQGDQTGALSAYHRASELNPFNAQFLSTYRNFRDQMQQEPEGK